MSWATTARASWSGVQDREKRERDPCADPLHRLQQPEPAALARLPKAVERDALLADLGLDQEIDRLARAGQGGERARGAEHQVADPADIDHRMVLAQAVQTAVQSGDHGRGPTGAGAAGKLRSVAA